jgi:hypothetical protein
MSNNNVGLNVNDLKQLAQMMATEKFAQNEPIKQMSKLVKKVTIQSPQPSENSASDTGNIASSVQRGIQSNTQSNTQSNISTESLPIDSNVNFELMGYVVNKHTVYLLIALLLIGIMVWYMTSDNDKKKKSKDSKDSKDSKGSKDSKDKIEDKIEDEDL